MVGYKDWIIKNNRVSAPVLAILFSTLDVLAAVYFFGELMFLVPVITFFTFHYTKLYRFKLRLLAGAIVFIVIAFVATGVLTSAVYNAHPTYTTQFTDGSTVNATVSPYSGTSQSYTYTIYVTPNGTFDFNSLTLNIHGNGGFTKIVSYSEMTNQTFAGNDTHKLTYLDTSLASGVFSYNLTAQKNGTIYTPEISGPLNTSEFVVYTYLLPTYAIYYLIVFELVYVAGLFIARSIAGSRKYREQQQQQKQQ